MADGDKGPDDVRVEQTMGLLLRAGVLLAALATAVGGAVYLVVRWHDKEPPYETFPLPPDSHPADLNSVSGVVRFAFTAPPSHGLGRGLIQLGVLLLIATPVARVAFSVYVFARQRDRLYVAVTLVVLVLLLFSLLAGPWLPGG